MRRMLGLLAVTAVIGVASTAYADQITGPIKSIDRTANTFVVHDTLFAASPENTVGAKLANLNKGDRVSVFYAANSSERYPWNAMIIRKIG